MKFTFGSIIRIYIFVIISLSFTSIWAQNTWVEWEDESVTWLSGVSNNSHEKDIAVGDLNNDGLTDIIVAQKAPFSNAGPRQDLLLINNGTSLEDLTATYAPGFISNPTDARDVYIGDFDDDGWDDVVIANTFGDQPVFYHNLGNDGNGNWLGLADESAARFPQPLNVPLLQFCALWAGDIDNNGSLDIYFSNYGQNSGQGGVLDVLLINNGNGFFTDESQTRLGDLRNSAFGTSVEIHDMDGDDDLDIVKISTLYNVPPWNSNGVFLLFNDGSGNFSNWQNLSPAAPYMFTIDDFDDNGLKDLYVVDDNSDYVLTANFAIPDFNVNYSFQTSPDPRTVFFGGNCKLSDIDKDGDMDFGIAGVDVDIPPCQITGIRQFTMDRNDNGSISAPYGPVNYPWNVSAYDFAFINLNDDCFPDLFLGLCDEFVVFINQSESEEIEITGDTLICGGSFTTLSVPIGYQSYSWSNGNNNQSITTNQEGTYCVTVTKENGCTIEDCVSVEEQTELYVEITGDDFLCFDDIETNIIASSGFTTYEWSTNETTQSIFVAAGGIFCVTVTDDNGCQGDTCTEIIQYPEVVVNISGETVICNGGSDTLTATGGFETYLWTNNDTNSFTVVEAGGTYCVEVSDQNGCIGMDCITIEEISEAEVNISGNNVFCFDETETLTADHGFSSYLWSNDEITQSIEVNESGDYCVTVTDDNGCTASSCFTTTEIAEIAVSISGDDFFCFDESGMLSATSGFTTYLWANNETTQAIEVTVPGNYCVTVTDDFGCTGEACFSIFENPQLMVNISGELEFCEGESSELTATGGFDNYLWSTNNNDSTITVETSGLYCVTVTDANACTVENCVTVFVKNLSNSSLDELICFGDTLEVAGEIFTEAGDFEIILQNSNEFGCDSIINLYLSISPEIVLTNSMITKDDGNNTGSIEIEFEGGTPPYIAEWDNGGFGGIIENLSFGDYTVTITDTKGCTETFSFTVELETATKNQFETELNLKISPNPFSENTQLNYELQTASNIQIDIFNLNGQLIENLFTGDQLPGDYRFVWNPRNQISGVYYFKIQIDRNFIIKKVVLTR